MEKYQLISINDQECCRIVGGADKNAQSALYYIGYAIGFLISCIARLFGSKTPQVQTGLV